MTARPITHPGSFWRRHGLDWLSFVVALGMALGGLAFGLSAGQPLAALLPFVMLAGAVVLWRKPIIGIYILFSFAILIEVYGGTFRDATTELVPFWRNLSRVEPDTDKRAWLWIAFGIPSLAINAGEILMVATFGLWLLRNLLAQTLTLRDSVLMRLYSLFLLVVAAALLHGISTGGDLNVALWEVRAPFYGLMMLLLVINVVQTRRHIAGLGWVLILATGLKGIQGVWRYAVTFDGNFAGEVLLGHEEALFFPAYYIFVLLMFIFRAPRGQRYTALGLLPFVLLSDLANRRRASTGALLIGLILVVVILFRILREHRRLMARWTFVGLVLLAAYVGTFWTNQGRPGRPIQAIRSQFTPSARDESSNRYRDLEDQGLMQQIYQDPLFGRGYGIEMPLPRGMVDLRHIAPFILYMPHNSILWVWWRTGLIGFTLFWITSGAAIVYNCMLARSTTDPLLRQWAVFAVAVMIISLMLAWWDLGLAQYREVVYVWSVAAIPEVLRRIGGDVTKVPAQARSQL